MSRIIDHPIRLIAVVVLLIACEVPSDEPPASLTVTTLVANVALSDMNALYPRRNPVPTLHNSLGLVQACMVTLLSRAGLPTTVAHGGRIVLLRSDGLTWARNDFEADGTHPSQAGERKVGAG